MQLARPKDMGSLRPVMIVAWEYELCELYELCDLSCMSFFQLHGYCISASWNTSCIETVEATKGSPAIKKKR